MGQPRLPIPNRTFHYAFWENLWSSDNLYSYYLNQDFFFKKFLYIYWNNWMTHRVYFFNFLKYKPKIKVILQKHKKYKLSKINNYVMFVDYYKKLRRKISFFTSRAFILRYQNWIYIYIYLYMPKIFYLRKKIVRKKKSSLSLIYLYNKARSVIVDPKKIKWHQFF